MRWLIPIGLGAAVAALVIHAKKKENEGPTLTRTPPRYDPNQIRRTSPGQDLNPAIFGQTVNYNG